MCYVTRKIYAQSLGWLAGGGGVGTCSAENRAAPVTRKLNRPYMPHPAVTSEWKGRSNVLPFNVLQCGHVTSPEKYLLFKPVCAAWDFVRNCFVPCDFSMHYAQKHNKIVNPAEFIQRFDLRGLGLLIVLLERFIYVPLPTVLIVRGWCPVPFQHTPPRN